MAQPTIETPKTEIPKLTPEQLADFLNSPAGQSLMRKQVQKRPAHTAKEIEKFTRMAENGDQVKYVRIDPTTKKEHEEAKEFFWRIVSFVPDCVGINGDVEYLEGDLRISFLIQKFHRDEKMMYDAKRVTDSGETLTKRVHRAFSGRRRDGSLSEPGDRLVDGSDFVEQFKKEEED